MSTFGVPILAKYHDLELPVFETGQVLRRKGEFREAARKGQQDFMRRVNFNALGFTSLHDCLKFVDVTFLRLTEVCGARVVPHQWGLYASSEKPSESEQKLLPSGHLLGARVNTIQEDDSQFSTPQDRKELEKNLHRYYEGEFYTGGYILGDITPEQFMIGEESISGDMGIWLVDVDIDIWPNK
jgi:hypothetical protein